MRYGNCMNGYFGHCTNYYGFGAHLFFIVGVIIIITLLLITFVHNKEKKSISSNEAEEVLMLRYVNGEITEEEYQRMKKILR